MFYQRKHSQIKAVQLKWTTWCEMCEFLQGIISPENPAREVSTFSDTCGEVGPKWIEITVPTIIGSQIAKHGDWILKSKTGQLRVCPPKVFTELYEPVLQGR